MYTSAPRHRPIRLATAVALACAAAMVAALPATAFSSDWTSPKRVHKATYAPAHSMVTDSSGAVHIAVDRGSSGIWYVTNASGGWNECRLTSQNDRQASIGVSGDVVHIAFARLVAGQRGIYTASSDQPVAGDCGWAVTRRFAGVATHPSLGAYGGTLSIAFRTGAKLLKFIKGPAATTGWTIKQTIDTKCCTSAPALALTNKGAPRVAYGDGTSRANGLKYAVRTSSGWKKTRFVGGRIKQVSLVLDHTPGVITPPSNSPHVAFVRKGKGTYHATKKGSGVSGSWQVEFLKKAFGGVDLVHHSNLTNVIYAKDGNLWAYRKSGGIRYAFKLSGAGVDTKPQVHGYQLHLTFGRKSAAGGVYYTRKK